RLGEADRDRLLRRASAVLAFPNVMHLFAHELSGLRRWRLPLGFVFFGRRERFFVRVWILVMFRHDLHLDPGGAQEPCQLPLAESDPDVVRFSRAFVVTSGGPEIAARRTMEQEDRS